MTYDAADNARKCYDAAVDACRDKLASFRKEVIGECTLILGDCREVLPLLPRFDAVVTDPPYGVKFSSGWQNKFRNIEIANDGDTDCRDWVLTKFNVPALIFGSWKVARPVGTKMVLVWDKGTVGMGDLSMPWFPGTEEIYVVGEGWAGTRTRSVLPHYVRNESHPTEKPVSLMRELIGKCPERWTIVDPFMGSGTTGVACTKMGRKFIGVELEEAYFATACRRIEEAYKQPDLFVAPSAKAEQLNLLEAAE